MRAEGFEYVPEPRPILIIPDDEARDRFERAAKLDPGSVSYREEFGFGISTLDALLHVIKNADDVNVELRDITEQEKYERALYRNEFVDSTADGTAPIDQQPSGCAGLSVEEVSFSYTTSDQQYAAYYEIVTETRQRVLADSTYLRAETEWGESVADQGYPFRVPSDVATYFEDQLDTINVFLRDDGEVRCRRPRPCATARDRGGT